MSVGHWFNETTLHPLAFIAVLLFGVTMLLAPRRYALLPLLALACFTASAQVIVIATLDFNLLRIMVLIGWFRVVIRGEHMGWQFKTIDGVVIAWVLCSAVASSLLHMTVPALIQKLGNTYDAVGMYFLFRVLVRNWSDIRAFAQGAALISIPVAMCFLVEKCIGRNFFSIFGGVPEITSVRLGRLRCQGPFSHPIMAGCFWVALLPLMMALWHYRGWNRILAGLGIAGSTVVIITCASATPVGGALVAAVAMALYPFRRWISWIRWGVVLAIVVIQLLMISPIWHLMARLQFVPGASAWYRTRVIDEFIAHFSDWWLIGTRDHSSWLPLGHTDITNQYVLQGIEGGLLNLLLYLGIIALACLGVCNICRRASRRRFRLVQARIEPDGTTKLRIKQSGITSGNLPMAWALGSSLLVQCIVFMGISYFGQTILVWFLTIAFIGSMTPSHRLRRAVSVRLCRLRHPRRSPIAAHGPTPVPSI